MHKNHPSTTTRSSILRPRQATPIPNPEAPGYTIKPRLLLRVETHPPKSSSNSINNVRLLRTWKVRMTSYWPLSVALCLTGLGPGDSPLVIPSLCSLVLSCIISLLSFLSFLFFSIFPIVLFSLPYVFLHKVVSSIYIFITYQKKNIDNVFWLLSFVDVSIKFSKTH